MIKIEKEPKSSGNVYVCNCSLQEFYECGCIGRESCPGSVILKEEEVPDNAVKTNIIGCYWRESVHLWKERIMIIIFMVYAAAAILMVAGMIENIISVSSYIMKLLGRQ